MMWKGWVLFPLVLAIASGNICMPTVQSEGSWYQFDFQDLKQMRVEMLLESNEEGYNALVYLTLCHQLSDLSPIGETCGVGTNVASVTITGCKSWGKLTQTSGWAAIDNIASKGVTATFNNEAPLDGGTCGSKRSTVVSVLCATAGDKAPTAVLDSADPCILRVSLEHSAGCPIGTTNPVAPPPTATSGAGTQDMPGESKGSGWSGFSMFLMIALFALVVYCAAGIVSNMRNEGLQGVDAIPHREFWFALPSLISQLVASVYEQISSFFGRGGSSSYQSFNSTMNNSTAPSAAASGLPTATSNYSVI